MCMVDIDMKNKINNDGLYTSYKDQTSGWPCGQKCIVSTLILLSLIMSSFSLIGFFHLLGRVDQLQQTKDIASFTIISMNGTSSPTVNPTLNPSSALPSKTPTNLPSDLPSNQPTHLPSNQPTDLPSNQPTHLPSNQPSNTPFNDLPSNSSVLLPNSSSHLPTKSPSQIHSVYYVGDYKVSVQNHSHGNWLLCDGSFLDPRDYTQLFDVIGYLFGQKISQNEYVQSGTTYTKLIRFALPNPNNSVIGINGGKIGDAPNEIITLNVKLKRIYVATQDVKSPNGKDLELEVYQPTIYIGNLFIYAGKTNT